MEPAFHAPNRRRPEAPIGGLFAAAASASTKKARGDRRRISEQLRTDMEALAVSLAKRRGAEGITPAELVSEAKAPSVPGQPALLTIQDKNALDYDPRRDSWVGPFLVSLARRKVLKPKLEALARGGFIYAKRAAESDDSHGNTGRIYLHPEVPE